MRVAARIALILLGCAVIALAVAMVAGAPFAMAFLTYPYSLLSRVFTISILAAIAAPIIWVGVAGEFAALRGGAVNLSVVALGLELQAILDPAPPAFWGRGLVFVALMGALLFLIRNEPYRDSRPTPPVVRLAFAIFAVLLLTIGTALVFGVPIFPWRLTRSISVLYGYVFLGAAAYFIYAVVRPVWGNAAGQLWGFLAYDLVLIVPFLQHWPAAEGNDRTSLTVYLIVIVASGALAMGYLWVNRTHRFAAK